MENTNLIGLSKDSQWSVIDGEPGRVIHFTPYATVENCKIKNNSKIPYCCLERESKTSSKSDWTC